MKTAKQWIATIQDKTVKKYLEKNQILEEPNKKGQYKSFISFLESSFYWASSSQGFDFWLEIHKHFDHGSGLKTYNDFKHLDKSVKK